MQKYHDEDRCKVKCGHCGWEGFWWENARCPKCKANKMSTDFLIVFLDDEPAPPPPPPPPPMEARTEAEEPVKPRRQRRRRPNGPSSDS